MNPASLFLTSPRFAGGATDPFARRYDADGSEAWTLQFAGPDEPEAAAAVALDDEDEDLFIAGGIEGALWADVPRRHRRLRRDRAVRFAVCRASVS